MKLSLLWLSLFISTSVFADYTFLMRDKRWPDRPFFVRLFSSNKNGVRSFENYLQKGSVVLDDQGNPDIGVINGKLIHVRRTPEHAWDFSLDGHSLEFADLTTELCEGNFKEIEDNPDYWFHTVGRFCPWSTRYLMEEIRHNGRILFQRQ